MRLQCFGWLIVVLTLLAASAGARGEVIYRTNPDRKNKVFDLDANSTPDFRFWSMPDASLCVGCPNGMFTHVDGFSSSGLLISGFDAARVADRTTIGALALPDTAWQDQFASHSLSTNREFIGWSGDWDPSGDGMIGVSFVSELGLHYGWIRLKLGGEFVPRELEPGIIGFFRLGPIVESWAYESTPGAPIVAGAVPEAGTVALGVVGAAMVLIVGWRRRRVR
jgi:hypothetical protein